MEGTHQRSETVTQTVTHSGKLAGGWPEHLDKINLKGTRHPSLHDQLSRRSLLLLALVLEDAR